jgi:predicted outer membrane repeat protein
VTSNVATADGGGIYAVNMNLGEFTNVRFDSNSAGAGAF